MKAFVPRTTIFSCESNSVLRLLFSFDSYPDVVEATLDWIEEITDQIPWWLGADIYVLPSSGC